VALDPWRHAAAGFLSGGLIYEITNIDWSRAAQRLGGRLAERFIPTVQLRA
jgi:hypothetical protein